MAIQYTPGGYGVPASGDKLYFFVTGTTTPAPVYEDAALEDELGTSVTADGGGAWPPIYLDETTTYKAVYIRAGGDVSAPIKTIDPLNPPRELAAGSVTADMLASGAAAGNLGFMPINKAGDTMTGDLKFQFTPTALDQKSAGFRGVGQNNTQNGGYTFALVDTGRKTQKTDTSTASWSIPPNSSVAFPEGSILVIVNSGASGDVTITRGVGVELRANGSGTSEDKTLAPYTAATLLKVGADSWIMM